MASPGFGEVDAMQVDPMWRPLVEPQRHADGIRLVVHAGDNETRRAACGAPAAWTWLWRPADVFPAGPVQGAACCPLCLHLLEDITQEPAVERRRTADGAGRSGALGGA
jgi:hypothetical protein